MRLHIHRFKYLAKEYATIKTSKNYHYSGGIVSSGSMYEDKTEPVTYIRSVCLRCGYIKTQVIPGSVRVRELIDGGIIDAR